MSFDWIDIVKKDPEKDKYTAFCMGAFAELVERDGKIFLEGDPAAGAEFVLDCMGKDAAVYRPTSSKDAEMRISVNGVCVYMTVGPYPSFSGDMCDQTREFLTIVNNLIMKVRDDQV